jgi:Tol biopolymer transport system component
LAEVATLDALVSEKPELQEYYDRFCITHGYCAYVPDLGLSPNKKWAVFFSVKNGTGGLSIVNVASKRQWDISNYDITGESCCDSTVVIEHWSHDGHYLYVSPHMAADGGDGWFWRSYIQLIRINLENGTWINTNMGSSYSFSPNDRFIAFRRGTNLVIYEFQTGNERIFALPTGYTTLGRVTWSSDSKQIIFVCSSVEELLSDDLAEKPNGFTLFLLNVDNMQAQAILEKDERYLYPIEWQTPSNVLLGSLYKVMPDGNLEPNNEEYILDLETNNISKSEVP